MELKVRLDEFEGSLDLLLFLVRKHRMNPLELRISEITDEFVEYVNEMKKIDINVASDFMVMASTLMEMKSRLLLSPEPEALEKQNVIAKKLYEYSLIKEAAQKLEELYDSHSKEYSISISSVNESETPEKMPEDFWSILKSVEEEIKLRKRVYSISKDSYSVAKKFEEVKDFVIRKRRSTIKEILLQAHDRLEAVVIFVVILELLRIKFLSLDLAKGEVSVYEDGIAR